MATAAVQPVAPPALKGSNDKCLPDDLGQNGGRISTDRVGFLKPTPFPIEEMRQRLRKDGYLFVKGLIPREDVLDMREIYFRQYESTSLLEPGTSPRDGIFNSSSHPGAQGIGGSGLPVDPVEEKALIDAHSEPHYRAFVEHPALTEFIRKFMDWKEHRLLDRTMFTGIHYDKLFLRGGEGFFLTAWVPIGDIAVNGSGLCYLENSVPLGRHVENDYTKRAESFTEQERISAFNVNMLSGSMIASFPQDFQAIHSVHGEHKWLVTDYEAGDVVFHDPYSIHASGRNEDKSGRIRLSSDLRFYDKSDPGIDTRWYKIWAPGDGL
ncbi:hypothetical protein N7532_004222 [Penicillium argentinense]|uniref:Phytanoyl-CoA dioxygenase n=1 Tax=Penicillium argentinense TaxID=1131581 RepID=A0A9W9KFF4_9EURO|nr:uncharacterized protein N7532_004222 [Penicillium argentinense]KAJ5103693.1 hypothetical protein N7532_004222 [Penicillium argentinense]